MTAELARSVGGIRPAILPPAADWGHIAWQQWQAAAKAIGAITAELTVIGTILFGLSGRERGRGSEEEGESCCGGRDRDVENVS